MALYKPESITAKYRLDIDVLYCRHFLIPEWDVLKQSFDVVLLPDDMPHNEALFLPFLRRLSYGTIEIETGMAKGDFDKIIDEKKLPRNMDRQTFHEGFNAFITHKQRRGGGRVIRFLEHAMKHPERVASRMIRYIKS